MVTKIDLLKCRPYKDFGQGFYLTDIPEQARKMAIRVARMYGGSPLVSAFSFDESKLDSDELNVLSFEAPCKEWALFVLNNRNKKYSNFSDTLCNQDNKYDIVYGPIANDDIVLLYRIFNRGLIDIDALIKGLEYKELTSQYSFHTQEALKYLTPTED
jgi:hypothetical protein